MNRFRTKKRAKDDLAAGRSSEDSEQSSLSFFRKGKKSQQEEVKKEIDLSNALPTNDDFRTSLLMNNLSARFSMLREQDDPNTKIGKASDDSVLFTKRQSKLADFGFGAGAGLSDIAEVESVRGPNLLRTTSVASDDPDSANGGSVLTRSRPTEGNVLFGGRQKIYKIPAASGGGMSGRAVYEEDVAMSAFQRWRQTERDRTLDGLNGTRSDEAEEEPHTRSESPPPMSYRRKRETTSTTSSNSVMARNSTAATSVTSQAAGAAKDSQPAPSAPSSSVTSNIPERSVTRTRRLYEQGFNQDSGEQPGSVLSRIEALTRPRPFVTRAADNKAFQSDGIRTILAKTSAPSLRSLSPSASSRPIGALELGARAQTDPKNDNLGGLPPLSPPVSETGEQPGLPILPKDVGGIFQKPSQPYDESQYVQRQLQLQQGRETPTQRHRAEAESNGRNTPVSGDNDTKLPAIGGRPPAPNAALPPTPVAETESSQSNALNPPGLTLPVESHIERPSDKDHPAFRQSALPIPPAMGAKSSTESSSTLKPEVPVIKSQKPPAQDSPTLGPASGLSGLVRQHLRTESVESSLGETGFDATSAGFRYNVDAKSPSLMSESGPALSPWPSSDQDWLGSHSGNGPTAVPEASEGESQPNRETSDSGTLDRTSTATEDETDGFANQLANARRRVREKLTSYVESDSSRATSPLLVPTDLPTQAPNGLGILKPKSSRGSLMDRSRNAVTGQSKGLKILGLGAATMSTSPQPGKQSFEEKETRDDDSNTHPGLRAFRQARRDLQKRKELETLARHQASQTSQSPEEAQEQRSGMHSAARVPRQRTPSRERRPPPVTYRQHHPSDDQSYSSPNGMRPSGERSRSGSETSAGRSGSRPPRLRTNTNNVPHDQLGAPNPGRPMMRSPGLPGTDIKNSPVMPPYPYPSRGAPSPAHSPHPDRPPHPDRSRSATNLALHTGRPGLDPHSGQPSPISPMGLPSPSPYAASPVGTPTSFGPRPRLQSASQSPALGPANGAMPHPMRRPVDKRDISEPTFVTSTSRVPTTTLPQHAAHSQYPPPPTQAPPMIPGRGTRSRSNSRTAGPAPPLPPINPRRRQDSRPRAPYEDTEMATPPLPYGTQGDNNTSSFDSGDEGGDKTDQRRRLRKAHPDMQGPGSKPFFGRSRENSPPLMANGPSAGRSGANQSANNGMAVPGGMI
ncbi:hypothetical protein CHGG_08766 [Chaetomium globosum CBS 148.51]|uniref:Uncharacterized protein n=1 Tax=Chaetomium globosum (strain ATCC 6205 / CBS 148.51 / DSM 1962 / NBRC 6347 / NRRL 1970) TaxID=306901 RepID=Q2GTD8_CHAGB|nr:uncharacterized protein CHGG_08766 [Chaetomium globosum CBS 148.51]EAQ84752.1 hypothetical protein CHGG_08766 [Chaetomium globosum CBS 148.51]